MEINEIETKLQKVYMNYNAAIQRLADFEEFLDNKESELIEKSNNDEMLKTQTAKDKFVKCELINNGKATKHQFIADIKINENKVKFLTKLIELEKLKKEDK